MLKANSIHMKLFLSYSALFMSIIIILATSFYIYMSNMLINKVSESVSSTSGYISLQLDEEIINMDRAAKQVIFSNTIKDVYFNTPEMKADSTIQSDKRILYTALYNILGPSVPPIRQINLIDLDGRFIGIGDSSKDTVLNANQINDVLAIQKKLVSNMRFYISPPHKDLLGDPNRTIFSVYRLFSDNLTLALEGIVEIQQNYSVIPKAINKIINERMLNTQVYVYNKSGGKIYPIEENAPEISRAYLDKIINSQGKSGRLAVKNDINKTKDILTYSFSEYSNWYVIMAQSEKLLLAPVNSLRNLTIIFSFCILLITLAVSYFVARGLTIPIKRIHSDIKTINLQTLEPEKPHKLKSGINELEDLYISFNDMCKRLKLSLDEVISSRSHEIQARMLALQSQMNPHFLYNTLSTISITAEEKGNAAIVKMCFDLSNMLRYVSSDSLINVSIRQELDYTSSYLHLMKKRYADYLNFIINVPEDMMDFMIPKLVIQPIVENCIKYGINIEPPWNILVEGSLYGNSWIISVRDNGQGFDEKHLEMVKQKISLVNINSSFDNFRLDGMGLLNIYSRLRILYGQAAIFNISNHTDGGAMVVIGGPTGINGKGDTNGSNRIV